MTDTPETTDSNGVVLHVKASSNSSAPGSRRRPRDLRQENCLPVRRRRRRHQARARWFHRRTRLSTAYFLPSK